jgi:hypothetical protein
LASDSTDTVHTRLYYVFDQMLEMIPEDVRDNPMAKMIVAFTREGKKDIRRLDPSFIGQLCKPLGEALVWVVDGSMEDLNEH